MPTGYQALSEKEKQTLRLIVRGHDAKSMARYLGLSVHTVNERLRDARRKLEVSSSRQAARLVFDAEAAGPQNLADEEIREAAGTANMEELKATGTSLGRAHRVAWIITGVVFMSIILGLLAMSVLADRSVQSVAPSLSATSEVAAPPAVAGSDVVRAARDWLALGDQGRWKDGWLGTSESFRKLNTVERWTEVSKQVRVPLGALVSRTMLSQDSVPAPPAGVEVVKFRTSFANKPNSIETVSLASEGGDWKVVGIYLD